jgi:ribosomal protein S18 acetylase RimI-like enzyme
MAMRVRTVEPDDLDALVDLTIRAFTTIQAGIREQLGEALFASQNGRWREDYRETLTSAARDAPDRFLVADVEGIPAGFATWTVHPAAAGDLGEITLLAVDPGQQRHGVGRALIDAACDAMRAAGCVVAYAGTGGDAAHAPARAAYEATGFTPLPTVFYSRLL